VVSSEILSIGFPLLILKNWGKPSKVQNVDYNEELFCKIYIMFFKISNGNPIERISEDTTM
jgi:hypothetical protein